MLSSAVKLASESSFREKSSNNPLVQKKKKKKSKKSKPSETKETPE